VSFSRDGAKEVKSCTAQSRGRKYFRGAGGIFLIFFLDSINANHMIAQAQRQSTRWHAPVPCIRKWKAKKEKEKEPIRIWKFLKFILWGG
jgi:hypothetical protein